MWRLLNLRAIGFATAVTLFLVALIFVGSRNLENFDAALVAYLFGTIFAVFGIAYRYAVWLQRPPTWRYFVRTWELLFSRQFVPSLALLVRDFINRILAQRFILHRGRKRWLGHMLMAWGCVLAFAVTIPLTFGGIQSLLLGYCFANLGSPAWAYTLMAISQSFVLHSVCGFMSDLEDTERFAVHGSRFTVRCCCWQLTVGIAPTPE